MTGSFFNFFICLYLEVIVSFEEWARLEFRGVELKGLGTGIVLQMEEDVGLDVVLAQRRRRPDHVTQLDRAEVLDLSLG